MVRPERGWWTAVLLAAWLAGGVAPSAAEPLVRIEGGIGVPGGTAQAEVSLADDPTGIVVSGLFNIDFPSPPLSAGEDSCAIAERLAGTHRLLTISIPPDRLQLSLVPFDGTPPFGDGALARCTFGIALGTPAGTAALTLDVALANAAGQHVPANVANGEIIIDAPRPTPTVTGTPTITPTATATFTVTSTPPPSHTPTSTPTATRFVPVVIADNTGGCAVAPPSGGAPFLLAAAIPLLLLRRRPPA